NHDALGQRTGDRRSTGPGCGLRCGLLGNHVFAAMPPFDLLMAAYYRAVDPVLTRLRKPARLRGWPAKLPLPAVPLAVRAEMAHGKAAQQALRRFLRVARRYDMRTADEPITAGASRA